MSNEEQIKKAHHDCKLVADSIVDEKTFQNADSGLVLGCLDVIVEALEKQIPKKPHRNYESLSHVWCSCGAFIGKKDDVNNYCANCGQKIDWEEGAD